MTLRADLPAWITNHVERYLRSNGADGHIWNGVPTLLLTTKGRRSGEPLTLPLIYGRDGADYVIVASKGGDARHPAWYLNLSAQPNVRLKVGFEEFAARARTASAADKRRLWPVMTKIWPAYDEYQAKTGRDIPVVVLERVR